MFLLNAKTSVRINLEKPHRPLSLARSTDFSELLGMKLPAPQLGTDLKACYI